MNIRLKIAGTSACVLLLMSGCSTESHSPPVPRISLTTPSVSASLSPSLSTSSKAADAWVELTPNTASGDGRVQLQCTQAGTALYWMYNLKTKAAVPFTQPMSADCKDTNPVAVASASTNESDPFTHWVLVSSSQDESRQTFLFCSPEHTGFYWHYDTSVENPLGGSIWGTMIPASPDCMS